MSGGAGAVYNYLKSSPISWKSSGKLQQTVGGCIERSGIGLHSGDLSTVTISPAAARDGRYFVVGGSSSSTTTIIGASIDNVARSSSTPLCTSLSKHGYTVKTVEHLLSALEATGVDNCRIHIHSNNNPNNMFELPILDGSASEWVHAIHQVGLKVALDSAGQQSPKLAPFLNHPLHLHKNHSFIAAFPYPNATITYGIHYPHAPAIARQWFSSNTMNESFYSQQIASSRTFCIYEEVEYMRSLGLIKGGSAETALICSMDRGWLNPPLRFNDEPCRHKVLDLIGDFSLLARDGNQGLLVGHIIAYKAGHSLHTEFVHCLNGTRQTSR